MSGIGGRVPELLNLHANLSTCHLSGGDSMSSEKVAIFGHAMDYSRSSMRFCILCRVGFFLFFFYPHNCCVHCVMLGADCMC